ncbi:hypothetical protein [Myxococcus landrumensis]|uniref:Lipoprotein n=1 Tax=Myxococcus landrumensis TaxID=2813577 RepID=A0ABX7MYJ4_9BACT|nr:hypothetical protein [Myxococcus landrumus]QSQ11522.1 hypothetical protein JY572_24300 [Myxococcus landrumus]
MKTFSRARYVLGALVAGALTLGVACKSDSGAKREDMPPPADHTGTSTESGTSTPPTSPPPDSDTGGSGIPTTHPPEDPIVSPPTEPDSTMPPGTGGSGTRDPATDPNVEPLPRDDDALPMPDSSNREDPYAPDSNKSRERPDGHP